MRMSAAAEQPVTLISGRSAAGMNATGESDIRGWYDTVAEGQTDEFKPRLERLLNLMFLAKDSPTSGRVPANWCVEFNPLWQPTDKELADTKKTKADTYVALVGAQIMTDAEAGLGLAPDFPTIDVDSRTTLAEADAEAGLRPREVNVPPPPEPDALGGGSEGDGPKAKTDAERADAQARVPAGSSAGGQFTSGSGGAGGKPAKVAKSAKGDVLTDEQRHAIRESFKSGKNPAVIAMQQKLMARYGMPAQKAALAYERDIKLQLKAAKAGKALPQPTAAVSKPLAAPPAFTAAVLGGAATGTGKAKLSKAAAAVAKAEKAVAAATKNPTDATTAKAKKAIEAAKAAIATPAEKKAAAAAKAKATKAANKAKLVAEAKLVGVPADVLKLKAKKAAADAALMGFATAEGFHNKSVAALQNLHKYGKNWKVKAAAALILGHWEKPLAAKPGPQSKPAAPKPAGPAPALLPPGLGVSPKHFPVESKRESTKKAVAGPLNTAASPHQAKFEMNAKASSATFEVTKNTVGKEAAEKAHVWGKQWVAQSTAKGADALLTGIDKPAHHLHAQYHATQALLKQHLPQLQKAGIVDKDGYITLYRGVKADGQGGKLESAFSKSTDGLVHMDVRGASSWSASHRVARSFAMYNGVVVQQKVHYSNAAAVHHFEPKWGLKEQEWVLVAKQNKFKVARADESVSDPYSSY
jgi:hypothetical protein